MTDMAAPAIAEKAKKIRLSVGDFHVRPLMLGGLFEILEAVEKLSLEAPPSMPSRVNWGAVLASPKSMSAEQKAAAEAEARQWFTIVMRWLLAQRTLLPAVLRAITDVPDEKIVTLTLVDVLKVGREALDVIDVPGLVEVGADFFSALGGRIGDAGRRVSAAVEGASLGGLQPTSATGG